MLNAEDNRLITEVGGDRPLGRLMRKYWVPILRSAELEPGADPHPFTMFGDRYVAFRAPDGRVGVFDEACPHRGASLALARVEDCALRCIYHGWKFDVSGEILEAPTHPPGTPLDKLRSGAHPTREQQGIIWTWLGEGEPAIFPKHGWMALPDDHVIAGKMVLNCSWLHPLETLWDVFHSQFLHNQSNRASPRADYYFSDSDSVSGGLSYDYPEMRVARTDYGFEFVNSDAAKDTKHAFVLPFYQYHATTPGLTDDRALQMSVPIDDDHTLLWLVMYNRFAPLKDDGFGRTSFSDYADLNDMLKGRENRTRESRWGQDREAMRRGESYSGVVGAGRVATIFIEDVMAIESQGRLDRSKETLGPVDRAVVEGRRTVIDAIKADSRGEPPRARDLDLSHVEAEFLSKIAD